MLVCAQMVSAHTDDRPSSAGARGPADSPGFLLWHATLGWQRGLVAALKPLGLTHVQFVLLACVWWLNDAGGGASPSQRRVADQAGTDPMMASQVLRALEARGLVTRFTDPADARVRRLDVTPQGSKLAREAIRLVEAADETFFAAVPDRGALLDTLRRLTSPSGVQARP